MPAWHGNRERIFTAMCRLSDWCQEQWRQHRSLQPRYGTIALGSADFDYLLKAAVGAEYLRCLRGGYRPTYALAKATAAGLDYIQKWNSRGCRGRAFVWDRSELHRWEGAGESTAMHIHTLFITWIK